MTTTTQDTRALIARLQARLGEGTHPPFDLILSASFECNGRVVNPDHSIGTVYTRPEGSVNNVDVANIRRPFADDPDLNPVTDSEATANAIIIAAALNELPAQIARWLARLDEADKQLDPPYSITSTERLLRRAKADTLLATVTEDVQAWAVRLGVGDG